MGTITRLTPNMPAATISEEEVSIPRLASILEAAVIDYVIDKDGDLYASDGLEFPAWIEVTKEHKLITFMTYIRPDVVEGRDWLKRVNDMNRTIVGVQFHWGEEGVVGGSNWMSYDGGLNVRQFVKMLRRFAGGFRGGFKLEDDGEVAPTEVSPPGGNTGTPPSDQ